MVVNLAAVIGLHEAGNVCIVAIAAAERVPELPDIPTLEELGLKNFRSAPGTPSPPPGTPGAIVTKLNAAVTEILKMPDVDAHLKKIHMRPLGGTPEDMVRYIEAERQRWSAVIQASGVKLD
jgi:tripartite-type tricarboxylate transporter receptor subunit TctC